MSCVRLAWLGFLLCTLLQGAPARAEHAGLAYPPDDTVALTPQLARASGSTGDRPDTPPKLRSYGWQTLVSDGLALGLLTLPQLGAPTFFIVPALLLGALGPPIIHAAHGNWAASGGSFGLRLLGMAGLFFGVLTAMQSEGVDSQMWAGIGLMLGGGATLITTSVLDAAIFSYERDRSGRRHAEMHILPWASARREAGLSLYASF